MSNHQIAHIELAAKDSAAAARFYTDLFGWKTECYPGGDYWMFESEPGKGGGFAQVDNADYKPGDVLVYVNTDNIEASLAKAEALGGRTLKGRTEIPGMGWYAFFSDPTGNRVGLFQTGQPAA